MNGYIAFAISHEDVCFDCGHGSSLHIEQGPVGCVGCYERTDRDDCPRFASEPEPSRWRISPPIHATMLTGVR